MDDCFFCNRKCKSKSNFATDTTFITCNNCGSYSLHDDVLDMKEEFIRDKSVQDHKHIISGCIREYTDRKLKTELLSYDSIINLLHNPLIPNKPLEKVDKLLMHIYRKTEYIGHELTIVNFDEPAVCYAKNSIEYEKIYEILCNEGFIESYPIGDDESNYYITSIGYSRIAELEKNRKESNMVFMAMAFNEKMFSLLDNKIKPILDRECKYKVICVSDSEHNNDINDEIIALIKSSRFVIADFTDNNKGVYFEAGFAQGFGIPVIRTCKRDYFNLYSQDSKLNWDKKIHFDVEHYNFLLWDSEDDLCTKLVNKIKASID